MKTMTWAKVNVYVTQAIFFLNIPFFCLLVTATGGPAGSIAEGSGAY